MLSKTEKSISNCEEEGMQLQRKRVERADIAMLVCTRLINCTCKTDPPREPSSPGN